MLPTFLFSLYLEDGCIEFTWPMTLSQPLKELLIGDDFFLAFALSAWVTNPQPLFCRRWQRFINYSLLLSQRWPVSVWLFSVPVWTACSYSHHGSLDQWLPDSLRAGYLTPALLLISLMLLELCFATLRMDRNTTQSLPLPDVFSAAYWFGTPRCRWNTGHNHSRGSPFSPL